MSPEIRYDVAIVGAGPAGALLGYHLARAGVRTAIFDKKILPRYKPCGGGLTARTLAVLPFDVTALIEDYTHRPMLLYNHRLVFQEQLNRPVIAMVMRSRFDLYLVEKAQQQGTALYDGCGFRTLSGRPGDLKIITDGGAFKARIIVGADGVGGRVGRQLGFSIRRRVMVALEGECAYPDPEIVSRYSGSAHFDFGIIPKGYAWVFPKKNLLSIGLVTRSRQARNLPQDFKAYLAAKGLSQGAMLQTLRGHLIPFQPSGRNVLADPRGLLVGDAAGYTDPLTGEGIYYAVRGAQIAATHIQKALNAGYNHLPEYTRAIQAAFRPDLLRAEYMARIIFHCPPLSKMLLVRKGGTLGRCQLDIVTGRQTYRELFRRILSFWQHRWWRLSNHDGP